MSGDAGIRPVPGDADAVGRQPATARVAVAADDPRTGGEAALDANAAEAIALALAGARAA